jgi:hypothetical protein
MWYALAEGGAYDTRREMGEERQVHVSERFRRMLTLYRRPDGSEWGDQDLENATGGPSPAPTCRT